MHVIFHRIVIALWPNTVCTIENNALVLPYFTYLCPNCFQSLPRFANPRNLWIFHFCFIKIDLWSKFSNICRKSMKAQNAFEWSKIASRNDLPISPWRLWITTSWTSSWNSVNSDPLHEYLHSFRFDFVWNHLPRPL